MFGLAKKTKRKGRLALPQNEDSSCQDTTDAEDAAETEYGNFTGNVGNMLMMGTLLFGFCATGTFLNIEFTGEESWSDAQMLVKFVEYGMHSAISSLTATMVVFVFSTRASRQHNQYGAVAAMRTVERSTVFFVLAEFLLYLSLHEFVRSIKTYATMQYVGPKLCPSGGADHFSFCGQTANNLFQAAQTWCSPAATSACVDTIGDEDADWTDCALQAVAAAPRARGDSFSACTAFDYFWVSEWEEGFFPSHFGWDRVDSGYPTEADQQAGQTGQNVGDDLAPSAFPDDFETDEAYLQALSFLGNAFCNKANTSAAVQQLCTGASMSTAACAQARIADFMADSCAVAKQDDALKCTKVCTWLAEDGEGGGWVTIKDVIKRKIKYWIDDILLLIRIIIGFRMIAGLIQVLKSCKTLVADARGPVGIAFYLDVFGLLDTWEGSSHKKYDMDDEESYEGSPRSPRNLL